MKRLLVLLTSLVLLTGCSKNLVQIDTAWYNNSIEYLDINSIHTSGWNKKEFTMITKFPLTNEKTITWELEIDCDKKLIRMSKDPSVPDIKSYPWNIIGNNPFDKTNKKDLMLYSLVCEK
jgi:hypothetical protein